MSFKYKSGWHNSKSIPALSAMLLSLSKLDVTKKTTSASSIPYFYLQNKPFLLMSIHIIPSSKLLYKLQTILSLDYNYWSFKLFSWGTTFYCAIEFVQFWDLTKLVLLNKFFKIFSASKHLRKTFRFSTASITFRKKKKKIRLPFLEQNSI